MSITGKLRNQFRFRFYRNLNKGGWSVAESNLPVVNEEKLLVYDAQFYSRPAGRAQVIESGVKNVHAYMVSNSAYEDNHMYFYTGEDKHTTSGFIEISYNPFVDHRFYLDFKYSNRVYIEPTWVLPYVISSETKLYIGKGHLYQFLKEQKFEHANLANKVFFDDVQILDVIKIRDFLQTLIKHRNEIMCGGTVLPQHTFDENAGLCDNLIDNTPNRIHDVLTHWLQAMFQEWNGFSGSVFHPVKDPDYSPNNPGKAYASLTNKYTGNYGANRFKLAKFLLKRLTENVSDLQITD